jgi:hypothetical protein
LSGKINTAIYIREGLDFSYCPSPAPTNIPDLNSCAATVKFSDSLIVNIMSVYLNKGPTDENVDWLRSFQNQKDKWIIGGDFNAHSPFWDKSCVNTVTSNRLVENIVDSNLFLLNNGRITRIPDIAAHKPSAIDLSFISPDLAINCEWDTYQDTLGSDHFPVIISLDEAPVSKPTCEDKIPKYNYNRANWTQFQNILSSFDTKEIKNDDIDAFYDNLCKHILIAADKSIPRIRNFK